MYKLYKKDNIKYLHRKIFAVVYIVYRLHLQHAGPGGKLGDALEAGCSISLSPHWFCYDDDYESRFLRSIAYTGSKTKFLTDLT